AHGGVCRPDAARRPAARGAAAPAVGPGRDGPGDAPRADGPVRSVPLHRPRQRHARLAGPRDLVSGDQPPRDGRAEPAPARCLGAGGEGADVDAAGEPAAVDGTGRAPGVVLEILRVLPARAARTGVTAGRRQAVYAGTVG